MEKNADLVNSWADSFYRFTKTTSSSWSTSTLTDDVGSGYTGGGALDDPGSEPEDSCEAWLEKEDSVAYSRDFKKDPIFVHGADEEFKTCAVGCKFGFDSGKRPDAAFGLSQQDGTAGVLRSMESAQYYAENNIDLARRRGYHIVMTTSLSSDVPVGYFSWAEYDIMAPLQPKTESALAAAFISNCGARNFRLQALEALEKANIKIDSYGSCHRNRDGNVDKVATLKRYKFSLAFENSNEEDYVTEKFFQSLVAGSVPVVVGAPNIQDFSPFSGSILHIRELKDVDSIVRKIKYLAKNSSAYNESLRWKFEGPSDSFKALVDMAAVHSSCRLCIYLATRILEKDEKTPEFKKRPCKCTRGLKTLYHIYARERGRFEMESVFLRSGNLTMEALNSAVLLKFKSLKHTPIWKYERPESIRGGDELKIYRIYPIGLTQRQALYTFRFKGDSDFRNHIESNPCAKFEVIFV
ncbi:glycoprotein 3-alpha-L-fucosyltransferase A-like [Olea europaea var. sylvestris]|uniref:glycoprotein 3-alpha-L-fucosyltransferase A-like n=1 Tax=Olea europaea var. sylvestris TaxID=158386 RepID=UPI000C1D73A9|nr:glycoprotein 3-alpha-L-fucosyltransferase A-like [Olea europaea var. sylvestris]